MTDDEYRACAFDMMTRLHEVGDPFSGDDWNAMQVARRLLEMLPKQDGGEPTTEAWLRAVGMIDPEPYSEPDKDYYGDQVVAVVVPGEDGLGSRWGFMYSDGHDGWSWWACLTNCDGFNGSQDYLCPVPTRDHVRQFCKVFNIKLKETA